MVIFHSSETAAVVLSNSWNNPFAGMCDWVMPTSCMSFCCQQKVSIDDLEGDVTHGTCLENFHISFCARFLPQPNCKQDWTNKTTNGLTHSGVTPAETWSLSRNKDLHFMGFHDTAVIICDHHHAAKSTSWVESNSTHGLPCKSKNFDGFFCEISSEWRDVLEDQDLANKPLSLITREHPKSPETDNRTSQKKVRWVRKTGWKLVSRWKKKLAGAPLGPVSHKPRKIRGLPNRSREIRFCNTE